MRAVLLARFGFADDSWRLDPVEHPFATSFGTRDIRMTTRYPEGELRGIFAAMHEGGHGAVRAQRRPGARAHAALPRHLARPARVAEPAVGEPRRPQPPVLDAGSTRSCSELFPGQLDDVDARELLSRGQPGRALADPDRGRRGDLQPPHHPPLRARAGADRRRGRARGPARGLERADARVPRRRGPRRRPRRAPGRPLVGAAASATSRPTPRQRHRASRSGTPCTGTAGPRLAASARAIWRRSAAGCASSSTGTAASSRRRRRSSGWSAADSIPSRTCGTCAGSSRACGAQTLAGPTDRGAARVTLEVPGAGLHPVGVTGPAEACSSARLTACSESPLLGATRTVECPRRGPPRSPGRLRAAAGAERRTRAAHKSRPAPRQRTSTVWTASRTSACVPLRVDGTAGIVAGAVRRGRAHGDDAAVRRCA